MTRERYLTMCEQLGKEPLDTEIPPDWEDFPDIVVQALNTFNMMGDRVAADIGYLGKDYTNLPIFMEVWGVEDKELFLDILHFLETRAVKQSQEVMKRERDKLKRKTSG
jgi:hypothetical protein